VLGHNDSEADDQSPEYFDDVEGHTFGWDNESPERRVHVGAFKAEWRPITNHEFQQFWLGEGKRLGVQTPKSWVIEDDVIKVFFFNIGSLSIFLISPRSERCMVMSPWKSQHTGLFLLHTTT
jgi:hypothetical protein